MAQQAAFAQVPDVVKRVRSTPSLSLYIANKGVSLAFSASLLQFIVHFHQAVLENNLEQITVAYESGWNRLTEKYYSKTEWPEAEIIAPLVNNGMMSRKQFCEARTTN